VEARDNSNDTFNKVTTTKVAAIVVSDRIGANRLASIPRRSHKARGVRRQSGQRGVHVVCCITNEEAMP
jgi:hypothetical protein